MKFEDSCINFLDVNECSIGTHNCHGKSTCNNMDGSYTCACNTGYHGNGVICTGRKTIDVIIISCNSTIVGEFTSLASLNYFLERNSGTN